MHADPTRAIFKNKTLLYMEESMARWLMEEGALPLLVVPPMAPVTLTDFLKEVDGLLLQGGSDVAPQSYGKTNPDSRWPGDPIRDQFEMTLVQEASRLNKPILGICRGAQMINVAFGGTLFQDIPSDCPKALCHRNWDIYDQLNHEITIKPQSWLSSIYAGKTRAQVNSVHHQGIDRLAPEFQVEAYSTQDQIIEAIGRKDQAAPFVYGVQWHPEFHSNSQQPLLDPRPIIRGFLNEVAKTKGT